MKFEERYTLRDYEVDRNDRIKPNYLSYYAQETAERCINKEKYNSRRMHEIEHRAYIISRLLVEIYTGAERFSELKVRTWISEGHGAVFPRHHEFIGENGELIARSSADWAVIETDNKKLVRFGDYNMGNVAVDEPNRLDAAYRFRIPNDANMHKADSFKVAYSQTDLNNHMNNVAYINPMYDNIPDVENMTLTSMNLHFKHEAKQGETLDVYVSRAYDKENDGEIIARTDSRAGLIYFVRLVRDEYVLAESAWGFEA